MANYKIVGFDKSSGVITVSFDNNMAPLGIDVPLNEQGLYITGTELDTYIQGFIPTWHLERINKIAAGIPNETQIAALVEITSQNEAQLNEIEINNNVVHWAEIEAEKQIAKVLVKFGLLTEDLTQINQTTL